MHAYRTARSAPPCSSGLEVSLGGRPVPLTWRPARHLRFLPGQGGLETLRLECPLRGAAHARRRSRPHLRRRQPRRPHRLAGDHAERRRHDRRGADVPARRVSRTGCSPTRPGRSPLRQSRSTRRSNRGGPALVAGRGVGSRPARQPPAAAGRGADPLTSWFQRTVGDRELTRRPRRRSASSWPLVLGGLHAIAPGHGKTLMAAYVVGRRGTTRQVRGDRRSPWPPPTPAACWRWAGDLAVAGPRPRPRPAVADRGQRRAARRLRPGAAVPAGGPRTHRPHATCACPACRPTTTTGTDHGHDHEHDHDHGTTITTTGTTTTRRPRARPWPPPSPRRPPAAGPHPPGDGSSLMGVAGGLVPTPSALVVLLGAIALHRTWFGVVLVGLYGLGMAGGADGRRPPARPAPALARAHWYQRPRAALRPALPPAITALLLVGGGLSIVLRGWAQLSARPRRRGGAPGAFLAPTPSPSCEVQPQACTPGSGIRSSGCTVAGSTTVERPPGRPADRAPRASVDLALPAGPVGLAELELLQLAGGRAGQLVAELDRASGTCSGPGARGSARSARPP